MMGRSSIKSVEELPSLFQKKAAALWKKGDKLFLACSGGMDSIVLGHLLKNAGYVFEILHVNFQLRGEESLRDEHFVRKMAEEWNMPARINRFDTAAAKEEMKTGVQETARNLRYAWFDEVLHDDASKNKWLLTAHHAEDQVETIAMNFFRGTGIAGLRGMKEKNANRIKPLLSVSQHILQAYAHNYQLKWVEDSSNSTVKYTRNLFRLEILPMIEKVFPAVRQNILDNAHRMEEVEQIYENEMDKIQKKLFQQQGNSIAIPVNLLKKQVPIDSVLHHIFSPFGFSSSQVVELKKLLDAPTGKYISSDTHRLLRNRNWLLIDPVITTAPSIHLIDQHLSEIVFATGKLKLDHYQGAIDTDPHHAFIDKEQLEFPLILRPWKTGDYFYPLGMKKKKKISRFLTDLKLSRTEKVKQWVLESNKKIVWVIGKRIDERFKVSSFEKPFLRIYFDELGYGS